MISPHSFARAFSALRSMPRMLATMSLVLGSVALAGAQQEGKLTSAQPTVSTPALRAEGLPLAFEPNMHQAGRRYKFLAHENGLGVGFLEHGIQVRVAAKSGSPDTLDISFAGSQNNGLSAENLLPGRVNYL